jgi:hypothetical protein
MSQQLPTTNQDSNAPELLAWRHWQVCLAIVTLAFLGYCNSLHNGFMLDDRTVLFGEVGIGQYSLWHIFTDYQSDFYRPAGHLYLWLCHQAFGQQVIPYHIANILLLALISYLTYYTALLLTHAQRLSIVAGLLYAVHPINGMLVNYVTANIISSFVIFMQLCFIFYMRQQERYSLTARLLSFACFIAALLSHEMAAVMPLVVAGYAVLFRRLPWRQACLSTLPYLAILGTFLGMRFLLFPGGLRSGAIGLLVTSPKWFAAIIADLHGWYASKLFWPHNILFLWEWPGSFSDPHPGLKALALLTVIIVGSYLICRHWLGTHRSLSLYLFCIGFAPGSMAAFLYYPRLRPFIEPHWYYFTSMGFMILLADGLVTLGRRWSRQVQYATFALLLGGLLIMQWQGNQHWRDEETYCEFWIAENPSNWSPYRGLGLVRLQQQRYAEAIKYFAIAGPGSFAEQAYAYLMLGDSARARELADKARLVKPWHSLPLFVMAAICYHDGQLPEAASLISQALDRWPHDERYQALQQRITQARDLAPSSPR